MTPFGAPVWLVLGTKLALSLALINVGFSAVSDDDFSRLVIAQSFTVTPNLDPSGTSWLPLPFIAYGTAFALFGKSLITARAIGLLLGALAALGIYVAARWLSFTRATATLAGLVGAVFPHAAYYGAATVPDYPTAVLALLGAVSLSTNAPKVRLLGAFAACAATLCRYETWPIAAIVAVYALVDWRSTTEKRPLFAAAIIAPLGAISWMLHGVLHHHDAFFFVKRVTSYKRALGQSDSVGFDRLYAQPLSLFRGEPELIVVTLVLFVAAVTFLGTKSLNLQAFSRPTLALLSLLTFLVVGDLRDGAPTHHGERVLLSLWCGLSLLSAELLTRLLHAMPRPSEKAGLVVGLGLLVVVTTLFVRPEVTPFEPFVNRSRELELGRRLTELLPPHQTVGVYTEDYGYFAIEAALGRPGAVKPLHRHDPRHPEPDPMSNTDTLATRLSTLGTRYFVVPATHQPKADRLARLLTTVPGFALYERN